MISFLLNIFFPGLGFFKSKQYKLAFIFFLVGVLFYLYMFFTSFLYIKFNFNGLTLFVIYFFNIINAFVFTFLLIYFSVKYRVNKIKNIRNRFFSIGEDTKKSLKWFVYFLFFLFWIVFQFFFGTEGKYTPTKLYYMPSGSMIPNILVGDHILAINRNYINKLKRGDLLVFKKPGSQDVDYIKRLIGLSGDTVQVMQGILYVNGSKAERIKTNVGSMKNIYGETMLLTEYKERFADTTFHQIIESSDTDPFDDTIEFKVPKGHLFFMGDNRDNSRDSRTTEVGFVPEKKVIGKIKTILYSINGTSPFYQFWNWKTSMRFSRIGKDIE